MNIKATYEVSIEYHQQWFTKIKHQFQQVFEPYRGKVDHPVNHSFEKIMFKVKNHQVPAKERYLLQSCNYCCLFLNHSFYLKFHAKLY